MKKYLLPHAALILTAFALSACATIINPPAFSEKTENGIWQLNVWTDIQNYNITMTESGAQIEYEYGSYNSSANIVIDNNGDPSSEDGNCIWDKDISRWKCSFYNGNVVFEITVEKVPQPDP